MTTPETDRPPATLPYARSPNPPHSRLGIVAALLTMAAFTGIVYPPASLCTFPLVVAAAGCATVSMSSALFRRRVRPEFPIAALLASGPMMIQHGRLLALYHGDTMRWLLHLVWP
jgi:hypothetical protein